MGDSVDFNVNRHDLRKWALEPGRQGPHTELAPGEVLIGVDRFAFTANNITYGAVGELIGYWNFFPARDGWGRIPVWGFGEVMRSRHEALPVGERVYGYLPISTHLVIQPDHVSPAGFVDAVAHRSALPPVYNRYTRVAADPMHERRREAHIALFRPLFTTAFLLDDLLAEREGFGARRVVLSSASSKTALGLAHLLTAHGAYHVVGLTSAGNADFVRRTGYYETVVTYDDVRSLPRNVATVFVDFAGDGALLETVHRHFDSDLAYSCQVGVTHWERLSAPTALPGPAPVFFFAPDQLLKRTAEWGPAEFQRRLGAATSRFLASTDAWLHIVEGRGPDAVATVYCAMLEGRANPAEGHILSLSASA